MVDNMILLVSPKTVVVPTEPRIALASMSANLFSANINHDVLELGLYKDWKTRLLKSLNHEYVGITATTGEMKRVEELIKFIKAHSDAKIILGGIHATLFPERTLKEYPEIDYCIRGEGEESLVEFLKKEEAPGLCYREGDSEEDIVVGDIALKNNINELPFPIYDKFELDKYGSNTPKARLIPMMTSRGCPYQCSYCSKGLGSKFRPKTPERTVEEIRFYYEKYNARMIPFDDDNFSLDNERAKDICRLLIKENMKIRWWCAGGLRVDRVDDELVGLMKEAGCAGVGLGMENVNNKILKEYNKHTTVEQAIETINLVKKHKIHTGCFFLVGAPSDTRKEIYNQLEFAKNMKLDDALWSNLVPYPDTAIWKWVDENNYWVVDNPFEEIKSATTKESYIYETPLLGAKEKNELIKDVEEKWRKHKASRSFTDRLKYLAGKNPVILKYATKIKTKWDLR